MSSRSMRCAAAEAKPIVFKWDGMRSYVGMDAEVKKGSKGVQGRFILPFLFSRRGPDLTPFFIGIWSAGSVPRTTRAVSVIYVSSTEGLNMT